ncbi:MAG: hypothetical protein RBS17_07520 [Coriobacteriia bacterium]|nr:hypothetical protein [Coriobacteriia bacterium]
MINYTMPLVASRVMVENAPDRLVIRENRWGGHTVADLGEYTAADHDLAALFAAAPDMYAAIASAMEILTDSWGELQLTAGDDQAYNVLAAALTKIEGR